MPRCLRAGFGTVFRTLALGVGLFVQACVGAGPGSAPTPSEAHERRAEASLARGLTTLAARQFEDAAVAAAVEGDVAHEIDALASAARCWLLEGSEDLAALALTRAERRLRALPSGSTRLRLARLSLALGHGDVATVRNDWSLAARRYDEALEHALGAERDRVVMRQSLLAERRGDRIGAARLLAQVGRRDDELLLELRRILLAHAPPPPAATAPAPSRAAAPVAATKPPSVLPRSAWGARRARANLERMGGIHRVTVHHTATQLASSSRTGIAQALKTFQRQHQDDKGWADIGYHFMIDPAGRIWEGRALSWQGAHAGSPELNVGNVGVALIGDFTVQQPTSSQRRALDDLLRYLCARYEVAPARVFTHREIRPDPTDCPGPALQRVVDAWRRTATPGAP